MSEAIIVAVITGGLSLVGAIITGMATSQKSEKAQAVAQAVMEIKIGELTREVRQHNGFAEKIPVQESRIKSLERRVGVLEKFHRQPTLNEEE